MSNRKIPPSKIMFADEVSDEEFEQQKAASQNTQSPQKSEPVVGNAMVGLPSEGRLGYPSTVEYRDILVKDEEVLATATADNFARTMNGVLKGITNSPEFFDDMCVHDRDYLLVYLWANNYSSIKHVDVECQHCKVTETHSVDLTELEVDSLSERYKGMLKIPLSKGEEGAFVRVRLNTVKDEHIVEEYLQRTTKNDPKTGERQQPKHSYEHLMMVMSIDVGMNIPLDRKVEWVGNNMTGKEMGYVRKFHEFYKFGVREKVEYVCGSCGGVTTGMLPFHVSDMLWPSVRTNDDEFLQLLENS